MNYSLPNAMYAKICYSQLVEIQLKRHCVHSFNKQLNFSLSVISCNAMQNFRRPNFYTQSSL